MTQSTETTAAAAARYPELRLLIDGGWGAGAGGRTEPVLDPATGAVLGHVPLAEAADLDRALAAAERGGGCGRTCRSSSAPPCCARARR